MTAALPPARRQGAIEPRRSVRASNARGARRGPADVSNGTTEPSYVCDAALTALFTPLRPELGRYEVCTTDGPLAGEAESLEALDAFGAAGPYDRAALQRLYGGTRVRVQRSWRATPGEFVSLTRLSPYPDPSLTRLLPGTMEIRFTMRR
jgi:hypothetical protein